MCLDCRLLLLLDQKSIGTRDCNSHWISTVDFFFFPVPGVEKGNPVHMDVLPVNLTVKPSKLITQNSAFGIINKGTLWRPSNSC